MNSDHRHHAGSLLPQPDKPGDYQSLQVETEIWLPAVQEICRRHDIESGALVRLAEGTNVVFQTGEVIVKLYPPRWAVLAAAEVRVTQQVYGHLGIVSPEIKGHGHLEGWPYAIMSRVGGTYLNEVWEALDAANQREIVIQLGGVLSRLHRVPIADLWDVPANWPELMAARVEHCAAHHASKGAPKEWVEQIPTFLDNTRPLYPTHYTPVLLSTDVHQYHLTAERSGNRWRLSGIFDFDDAIIGFREYDFSSPGLFMMLGRPHLLRAFLTAYGLPESDLNGALSRRLLAYTLIHRYRDLRWILEDLVKTPRIATLNELAEAIYGLE